MDKIEQNKVGDFYWAYADILRSIGLKESIYDERILAFMALKLLIDNKKLNFNFKYKDENDNLLLMPFGLNDKNDICLNQDGKIDYKKTFQNIIEQISKFDNTSFFIKNKSNLKEYEKYNLIKYNVSNELELLADANVFDFNRYINELPEHKFLAVLDAYNSLANFENYPRHKYKNLYEDTITRMKKLAGSLTGQHFTQTCIINLMTEIGMSNFSKAENKMFVIYDPTCGVGSMLYDAAFYGASQKFNNLNKAQEFFYLLGQEVNGPTWFLAKVFAEISGFNNFIAFGNTLTEPVLPLFLQNNSVDFIIANPPFGVDWKTDKEKVENILKEGLCDKNKELYYTITKDNLSKNGSVVKEIITPKVTDGQWLFFMHIAKALESNKDCKALILSSTSLLSNGKLSSDDGIIRSHFIKEGFIETVIEQPNSMFTNTDIKTHLWVMDKNNKNKNNIQLIKIDNNFINNPFKNSKGKVLKSLKVLFEKAEYQIEKQKNGYSKENIKNIFDIYNKKEDLVLFSKILNKFNEHYMISFEEYFNFELEQKNEIFFDMQSIQKTEESLLFSYINELNEKQKKLVDKVIKSINGEVYIEEEYFSMFENFYKNIFSDLNNKKFNKLNKDFIMEYSALIEEINKHIKKDIETLWKMAGV